MIQKRIVVGAGKKSDGIFIYDRNGGTHFYPISEILSDYNGEDSLFFNFSVTNLKVNYSSSSLKTSNGHLFLPNNLSSNFTQTNVGIPILVEGVFSNLGTYKEEVTCINGHAVIQFNQIS